MMTDRDSLEVVSYSAYMCMMYTVAYPDYLPGLIEPH